MKFGFRLSILLLAVIDSEGVGNHLVRALLHTDGVALSTISWVREKTAPYAELTSRGSLDFAAEDDSISVWESLQSDIDEQIWDVHVSKGEESFGTRIEMEDGGAENGTEDLFFSVRSHSGSGAGKLRESGCRPSNCRPPVQEKKPTLAISNVPGRINSMTTFTATFTFSENVTGFEDRDVTVTGGSRGSISGSGRGYTLPVTPDGEAGVTVEVAANSVINGSGYTGPILAISATAVWDVAVPAVTISVPGRINPPAAFTFREAVMGFTDAYISVTGGTRGVLNGNGYTYTVHAGDIGGTILMTADSIDGDKTFRVVPGAGDLLSGVSGGIPNQVAVTAYEPLKVEFDLSAETVYEGESVTVTARFFNSQATLPGDVTIPFLIYDQNWHSGKPPVVRPQAPEKLELVIKAGTMEDTGTLETIIDGSGRDEEVSVVFGTLPPEVERATTSARLIIKGSKRTVTLSATPNPVFEGSPDGVAVTAELSYAHSQDVRIPLTYRDKTTPGFSLTAEPTDYEDVGFITIPVNGTTGEETIKIPDEPLTPQDTEDETFAVAIDESTLPSDLMAGLSKEVEITIVDKDRPLVYAAPLIVEEGKTGDLKVALTEPPSTTFTVEIGGYQGTDFEATPPNPLTLQFDGTDWDTPKSVTLTAAEDDDDYEDEDEELLLTVKIGSAPFGTGVKVPVTIRDNDKVEVNLELLSPAVVLEGERVTPINPTAKIRVELSKVLSRDVSISLLRTQNLPTAGQPIALCPVVIKAGTKHRDLLELYNADENDDDEQYTVTLDPSPPAPTHSCHVSSWPVEVLEGSDNSVTYTIQDRPVVKLTASPTTVNEGDSVGVRLELSYALGQDVRIKVNAVPRTDPAYATTSWDDFEKLWDGTGILIPKGTTIGRDTVAIRADFEVESDEVFNLGYPSSLLPEAVRQGESRKISLPGTPCDDLTCATIIKDVQVEQVITLSASPNPVFEGNSTTLTVTLAKPLTADQYGIRGLQILSDDKNSQADKNDFTLPYLDEQLRIWNAWWFFLDEGETRKDVVIEIEDDGLDEGDENLIWDIVGYASGNMEANLACNNNPDSVCEITIKIRDPAEIVANPSDFRMTEGGSATFEVSLNTAPSADVTVTISDDGDSDLSWAGTAMLTDGNKLTFTPADYSTPQLVSLTAGEDDSDIANDTETLTLTASGAPEYTGVSAEVEVTIIDNDRGITVMPSVVTIDEGATVRDAFKVSLTAAPTGEVKVTLGDDGDSDVSWSGTAGLTDGNKLTFTPTDYSTPQPVSLTAAEDDDYVNDVEFLALVAFGAEYEGNYAKSMQVTIIDNDDAEIIATPPDVPVMEGGTATFSVSLSVKPSGNVTVAVSGHTGTDLATTPPDPLTVTFTSANYGTPQDVTITADEDPDIWDDPVTLTLTGSSSDTEYDGLTTNVAVTIEDNDAGTIMAAPSDVLVTEGGTATFKVSLSAAPSQNVTVAVSGHTGTDLAGTPPDPPSLTFTPVDYNTPQDVTITADEDSDILDDSVPLTLMGSNAEYDGLTAEVTVMIDDDDIGSIRAPFLLTMNEGETSNSLLDVSLSDAPSGEVTVTVTGHEGTDLEGATPDSPDPVTLIFTQTNYSIPQPVSLTAKEDDDSLDDTVNLLLKATGAEYSGLTKRSQIRISDNDDAKIIATPPEVRIKEGGTATFDVTLSAAPSQDVTVELHGYKKTVLETTPPDPLHLTFTPANYGMRQTITLSAGHDLNDFDEYTILTLRASGAEYNNAKTKLPVSIDDDEVWELTIKEGGMKFLASRFTSKPRSNIVQKITGHAGTDLDVHPSTWTVTPQNYNTPWQKTFTAGEDPDIWDDEVMLVWEDFGRGFKYDMNMRFTIEDNDDGKIIASPSGVPVTEGSTATFEVSLSHAPSQKVTVTVSGHTGTDLAGTPPDPLSLTFRPDNYDEPQPVTITADEDPDITNDTATLILTGSDAEYDGLTTNVVVTIEDKDAGMIIAAPSDVKIMEGGTATFDVSLSVKPTANVTVAVSGHAGTDLAGTPPDPLNLTFTPLNYDKPQSVTLTAGEDQDIYDRFEWLHLDASDAEYDDVQALVGVLIDDNDAGQITMNEGSSAEAFVLSLPDEPTSSVTAMITGYAGTDLATNPPDPQTIVFTPQNYSTGETVTLTADEDPDIWDDLVMLVTEFSGGGYGGQDIKLQVTIRDNDDGKIIAIPSDVPVTEGGTATFNVTLSHAPSQNVTVAVGGYEGTDLAGTPPDPPSLTFRPDNYSTSQQITITADEDPDITNDLATLTLTGSNVEYDGLTTNVAVTIEDNDSGTIIANPSTVKIREGAAAALEVSLSAAPSQNVTVAVSGHTGTDLAGTPPDPLNLTFRPDNYADPQLVTLTADEDPDILDQFEWLYLDASNAEYDGVQTLVGVLIDDNDVWEITMNEGSSVEAFGLALPDEPTSNVTVTITGYAGTDLATIPPDPRMIIFTTQNYSTVRPVTLTADEDQDIWDDVVMLTAEFSGGDYGEQDMKLQVTIRDNDGGKIIATPPDVPVTEGGTATFDVTLSAAPSENVTVTVSSHGGTDLAGTPPHPLSLTFRPDNYNTPRQITITADEDQDIIDDKEILILEASGAEYEGLSEEVRVTIKDNDDGGIIATPYAVTMTEGATETFDVTLGAAPSANVTVKISGYSGTDLAGIPPDPPELTFTPTDYGKAQTVTLTAGEDADVTNDMETLRLTASGAEYTGAVTDVKVSIIDKDQAGIVANPSVVPIAEGTSATFDVTLSAVPSADVTVAITGYTGTDLAPIPPNPDRLMFTKTDYGKAQTVTLTAGTDLDIIDETETLLLTASGAGYTGVETKVTVTINDKDAGSIIAPAALTITEGSTGTFKLSLSNAPSEDITVAVTGYMGTDLAGIPPSPNKLTFTKTNYGDVQTVTLTAGGDPDILDDAEALILTASGAEYAGMKKKIAVTIKDKDAGSIIVPAALTITEGSTGNFDVWLSNAPSENVTVLVSGHAGTGLAGTPPNPLRLTFTPADYGTPQPVTLTADEDNHDLFDEEVTLTLTASGSEYAGVSANLAVTIEDNDDGVIIAAPSAVTMTEGGTGTFDVSLGVMPSTSVTVVVSGYAGTDLAGTPPSPLTLMFTKTNYSTPQPVTLTADQDPDIINEKETLRLTASGAEYDGVSTPLTVSIIDNDQTGIVVSPSAVTVLEGAAATFDVSLSAMPSANVTVAVSGYAGTDLAGTPPSPASLTFTSANYNTAQFITLTAEEDLDILDDQEVLRLTASGSEYDGVTVNVPVTIKDNGHDPGISVRLSASPTSVIEGGTITVTATLSKVFSEAVTIPLEYTPGTPGPTEPNDYDRLAVITIPGGVLSGSGKIVTKEDRVFEGNETFMVALGDLPSDLYPGIPASLELTIEDNDMPPPVEVTLSVDPQDVIEGNLVTVTATLAGALEVDVTIPLDYNTGTSEPGDYKELEHVTVPVGETEGAGQIQTFQDSDLEDETFIVALGSDLPPEVDPGRASFQTITIRDIIPPQDVSVQFLTATQSVNEGETVPVTIELDEGLPADVVIPLTVMAGAADAQDYRVSSPIQVGIKAGETRGTSVIPTIQDDIVESDETFSVEVGELPSGIIPGELSEVVVTIIDDDEAGLNVLPSMSIVEGASVALNFSLTSKPESAVNVEIIWPSGTDLTVLPVQRIFTPDNWQTLQMVLFSAAEDPDFNDDQVLVTLAATGGGYPGISQTVDVTIIDNDVAGIHAPASVMVSEGGSETFDIRLVAAPSAAVTVTVPGTLGDLTATPTRLTFTEDNWARPRSITLMAGEDDDFLPDTEILTFTANGGGYDGETRDMSVTIMDDDEAGIEAPLEVTIEEGGTGTLPVRLLAAPSGPVTLTLAGHMGTDLALSGTSLTFTGTDWNVLQTVTLTAVEDNDFTDDRVELVLTASGGDYDHVHTTLVTIMDNDEQELPVTIGIYDERDSEDAGSLQLAIELSRSADEVVTVQYATSNIEAEAGLDYTASRGVVIFDPGATRGVIEIEIMDDDIFEESERFTVTLSNPANAVIARGTGTGTILDNDGSAKLRVDDALVQEEEGVVVFRVLLSHPQRQMVTAEYRTRDGSAKAGEDYEASSGVVTIAPGTMEALIAVSILKDGLDWQEETFTVHLESAKHAEIEKAVGVATIQESTTVSEGVLEAYASRFVRTASVEVVDALGDRFRAAADGAMCTAAERAEMAQLWYSASSWDPSLGELLADCRLSQSMPVSGGSFGVWGQGAFRQFNGRGDEALTLRGEVTTGMLGADYRWRRGWLAGVLLAHSQGDGSFEVKEESGEMNSALTGIYPYVSYTRAGWDVWVSAGAGRGSAEVSELKGDLTSRFGAMGMRGTLASGGAVGLSYHGDILMTDAEIADHNITAEVYRVRAGIEMTTQITGEIRPYMEANVRQDGGSAETGTGLELGGGVRFSNPAWRLRGEVRTQGLVMHTADGFTEWGISGSLQMGSSSEGLMMRLRPSWGRGHGMSMYNQQTILDAAPTGANAHRTELELGYGVPWKGGSARSIMGVTQLSRGMMYRMGGELRPWERLSFSVFGLAHGREAVLGDIGVNVQGSLRY